MLMSHLLVAIGCLKIDSRLGRDRAMLSSNPHQCADIFTRAELQQMRRCIPIQSATKIFEDPALVWGRNHPIEAQACLNAPEFSANLGHQQDRVIPPTSLEDYLLHRKWHTDTNHQRTLISHVLSAPLTASHILSSAAPTTVVGFVGARAEASLPQNYWLELLELLNIGNPVSRRLELHFTGPELIRRPDVCVFTKAHRNSSIILQWHAPGKYHELDQNLVSSFDMLILLNPGFGHPNLSKAWKPTLPLTKPALVTAHSELDAARDQQFLSSMYGMDIDYKVNPFASRIKYLDPVSKDMEHFVQPSLFYGIYQPK